MERIEVYPYQRIKDTPGKRWLEKKRVQIKSIKKANWGKGIPYKVNLVQVWKVLLTAEVLILSLMSFLLARAAVLGELLPFMFAFIAAFSRKRPITGFAMFACATAGLIGSSAGMNIYTNIITLVVLMGIINYIKLPTDKYWWGIPFVCMATIFLVKSIIQIKGGISFYGEMVVVFESLIAGILTFVFVVASDNIKKSKALSLFALEDIAAFLIIGIGLIMGMEGLELAGLSLSSILCRLGILTAAFLWGAGPATMVGAMVGLVPSITSSIFTFSLGLYTISGLLAGLFRNLGKLGIIIGFMLATMAFSLFIPQTHQTVLGIWETAIACLMFFLLPESLNTTVKKVPAFTAFANRESSLPLAAECLKTEALQRIRGFARVFDEIAGTLEGPGKPNLLEQQSSYLNYLYEEISSGFCHQCMHYEKCWEKYCYKTSKELLDLFTIAEQDGTIAYEKCSPEFRRACLYSRDIVNFINYLFASLRLNQYWKKRLEESCSMISRQMQGISRVIENLADDYDGTTVIDYSLKDKLKKDLKRMNIKLIDITPIKTASDQLYIKTIMNSCTDGQYCENQVVPIVSAALGEKVEVADKNCPCFMGKGNCEFVLTRACTYKVTTGVAQLGKETVCGDNYTIANLQGTRELIALSDGMGVGEEACAQSRSAVRMLETLLEAGFDKSIALSTINSTLLLRSTKENFATMDIAMIDLYTAEVDFVKTGSVPSFLKRGQQVEVISASSLPVGIVENIDIYTDNRRLVARDLLVMISDGIINFAASGQDENGTNWIQDLLAKVDSRDPQKIAEMIINRALSICRGKPQDDMTVICSYLDLNLP